MIEQDNRLVYFIPSPLLLASACPLNGEEYQDFYHQIIEDLLTSNLVDIDGLNHQILTKHTLDYFARHKYAHFLSTGSTPQIYYQCDALFTAISSSPSSSMHDARVSQMTDDGQTTFQLVYFITILNQRSLFSHHENFDQYLLQHLLRLHSPQIEKAFKTKYLFNQLSKGILLEHEQINQMTHRVLVRYETTQNHEFIQIDVNYFILDSYIDQFADTYVSFFHTPITMLMVNGSLSMIETLFSRISLFNSTFWGTSAMYELEMCVDHLFTRRGKTNFDLFMKWCSAMEKIHPDQSVIQQRMLVHAFATCVKHNAKVELEYLITTYARILYESCEQHPIDIRHNVLSYCVVSDRQISIRETNER